MKLCIGKRESQTDASKKKQRKYKFVVCLIWLHQLLSNVYLIWVNYLLARLAKRIATIISEDLYQGYLGLVVKIEVL